MKKVKTRKLSSGMLAKVKIAVTMARRAKVILLDEPLLEAAYLLLVHSPLSVAAVVAVIIEKRHRWISICAF